MQEVTVYQGQFGSFSVNKDDRLGVILYRLGLSIAALCLIFGTALVFWQAESSTILLTPLFYGLTFGLGLSLFNVHIYLILLHRLLKLFWLIGTIAAVILTFGQSEPLVLYVYEHPLSLVGIGFIFVALTGIYFKEAFCFNRLETKLLTPLVPLLLLGHLTGLLSITTEKFLLGLWGILFLIFVIRKAGQPLDPDLGDLSVFAYLKEQK